MRPGTEHFKLDHTLVWEEATQLCHAWLTSIAETIVHVMRHSQAPDTIEANARSCRRGFVARLVLGVLNLGWPDWWRVHTIPF